MKASAKKAQVSWWQKKYARFPPERAGYTNALRVARLVTGPDGLHLEKQDHQERETLMRQQKELMLQREEQERKKLEGLQRRGAESKKYKNLRKEMKEAVRRMKEGARTEEEQGHHEEYDDACFCTPIFPLLEESDWVKPSEEKLHVPK